MTEIQEYLNRFVEYPPKDQGGASEVITIDLSPGGESKSVKLSNVKFRLIDFLFSLGDLTIALIDANLQPARLGFAALQFIWKTREAAEAEIQPQDAQVLLAIFRLRQEKDAATLVSIYQVLDCKIDEDKLTDALNRLEKLDCIRREQDSVVLKERVKLIRL